jgi:uncharacterized protein HemY
MATRNKKFKDEQAANYYHGQGIFSLHSYKDAEAAISCFTEAIKLRGDANDYYARGQAYCYSKC